MPPLGGQEPPERSEYGEAGEVLEVGRRAAVGSEVGRP